MVLKRGARKRSGESARRDVFFFPMSTFQCFVGFAALTFYFLTNGTWKPRSPTNYVRNDWTDHMSANHRAPVTFGEKKVHWFFFVPPQPKHKKIKQTSHFLQKTCKESENIEHKLLEQSIQSIAAGPWRKDGWLRNRKGGKTFAKKNWVFLRFARRWGHLALRSKSQVNNYTHRKPGSRQVWGQYFHSADSKAMQDGNNKQKKRFVCQILKVVEFIGDRCVCTNTSLFPSILTDQLAKWSPDYLLGKLL